MQLLVQQAKREANTKIIEQTGFQSLYRSSAEQFVFCSIGQNLLEGVQNALYLKKRIQFFYGGTTICPKYSGVCPLSLKFGTHMC